MYRRAILFEVDQKRPSLIWVECETIHDPDTGSYESPKVSSLLGNDNPIVDRRFIGRSLRLHKDLSHMIEVVFRDTFLIDDSRSNLSILAATGGTTHSWRGPGLVMRMRGLRPDPSYYGDVTLEDYRHALDYFFSYTDTSVREPENALRGYNTVMGVKVTCFGEQKLRGAAPFVSVEVPDFHPTLSKWYEEGETPPISRMVGLPVRVWKIPYDWDKLPHWPYNYNPTSNGTAAKLFLEPDVEKPGWDGRQCTGKWILGMYSS